MSVSPLYIEMAIWYHCRAGDFERLAAPAVQAALAEFLERGLLRMATDTDRVGQTYHPTEGLRMWVERICASPLPELTWCFREAA